jgi:hypothetical protein
METTEESAKILYELSEMERDCDRIHVPMATLEKKAGALPFLLSLPGVSDATSYKIEVSGFGSVKEFVLRYCYFLRLVTMFLEMAFIEF